MRLQARTLRCLAPWGLGLVLAAFNACARDPEPVQAAGTCRAGGEPVQVIIQFSERADLSALGPGPLATRRRRLSAAVVSHAARTQAPVQSFLRTRGATEVVSLPLANAVAASIPAQLIPELLQQPGVAGVRLDRTLSIPVTQYVSASTPGWNLDAIGARRLWSLGVRGAGIVVANLDTGVDGTNADLMSRWRGGVNSWFDPFDHSTRPIDTFGHGTQTMSLMVGGEASGEPVGVAPEARWIAARVYDANGQTRASVLHQAFQWLLDPDGDPSTDDSPDIVNASWGDDSPNSCDPEFENDIAALRTAGILVVFAAGNAGPQAPSSVSPANNPGSVSVGAVDVSGRLAGFSSRGPSACTGAAFPDLVAPGVSVRAVDLSFAGAPQLATVSGTSFAAPHLAGAAALLLSVRPSLAPEELERLLLSTARPLAGGSDANGAGHGLLDVSAAYDQLVGGQNQAPTLEPRVLPLAKLGAAYHQQLQLRDAEPLVWRVVSGRLPDGIALDGANGELAGTPGTPGIFHFEIEVSTRAGTALRWPEALAVRAAAGLEAVLCRAR